MWHEHVTCGRSFGFLSNTRHIQLLSAVDWFKFRIEMLKEASLSNYMCLVLLRILAAACSTFGPKGPRVERDMLHVARNSDALP